MTTDWERIVTPPIGTVTELRPTPGRLRLEVCRDLNLALGNTEGLYCIKKQKKEKLVALLCICRFLIAHHLTFKVEPA